MIAEVFPRLVQFTALHLARGAGLILFPEFVSEFFKVLGQRIES
jgi:hypothetical protein